MAARDSRLEISGVVREHHGAATVAALGYNIARARLAEVSAACG